MTNYTDADSAIYYTEQLQALDADSATYYAERDEVAAPTATTFEELTAMLD